MTVTDGELHVEGLVSKDKFTNEDRITLESFIKMLGYDYYIKSDFKLGVRRIQKVIIDG